MVGERSTATSERRLSTSGDWFSSTSSLVSRTSSTLTPASIDNYSEEFKFTPYDGILGFAWPSSPGEGKPFWLRLADTWADKVFGMYLKRFPTDKLPTSSGSPGGSLTLGWVQSRQC